MISTSLLLVAGEASGDLLGARLLEELRNRLPDIQPFGIGGQRLIAAGLECVADGSPLAVVGLVEALQAVPRAWKLLHTLKRETLRRGAKVALLIDVPEFNLRLARALNREGVRVVYYVSPQIWAWRQSRVHAIRDVVHRMLVLFPFEADFYQRHGVPAVHVGHPLIDEVPSLDQAWDHLAWDAEPNPLRLLLLPGSRKSEVMRLLPAMLGALSEIAKRKEIAASLLLAPGLARREIEERVRKAAVPVEFLSGNPHQAMAQAHFAFVASGTATLEVGLLRAPMVVVYRLAPPTFWLAKRLVKVPHVSLVNLVLGREVVPELLQKQVSAKQLSRAALEICSNRNRLEAMRLALGELRGRLGSSGASARAAEEVFQVMRS